MKKLFEKVMLEYTLKCVTGLHIGDSKESTDIGGVDLPVVRRKDNNQPYIPGSSLKGKMRCLLDQVNGRNADGKCLNDGSTVCQLFGALKNGDNEAQGNLPSRLIVRDAYLTDESAKMLLNSTNTDMPFTEIKIENTIHRITGVAQHPRQQERVPAGAEFEVKFMINVFADDEKEVEIVRNQHLKVLKQGIDLLNHDYLGGSGSRGYGQVKLVAKESEPVIKTWELV